MVQKIRDFISNAVVYSICLSVFVWQEMRYRLFNR